MTESIIALLGSIIVIMLKHKDYPRSAILTFLVTVLLACCAHQRPTTGVPIQPNDQAALLNAWSTAGLSVSKKCALNLSKARVLFANNDDVQKLCRVKYAPCEGTKYVPCADSCALISHNVIVVHQEFADLAGHRIHELLHLLQYCELHTVDYTHDNQLIWCTTLKDAGGGGGFCKP